jgi:hypothetical protein
MNARLRIVIPSLAVLAVVTLATGGCACTPQPKQTAAKATQVPTATAETTASIGTTPAAAATGDVATPGKGSAERKALLDAARAKLGTSAEFYVYQLYTKDSQGIGDIESVASHNRWFVAWTGGPTFKAVWTTPVGGGSQARTQAQAAVSDLSPDLVAKMDWSVKKTTAVATADAATMKSNLSSSAKQWTKSLMSGKGQPYKVTSVKAAQDSSGKWWGVASVQPTGDASNQYESVEFWAKRSGTSWQYKAQDPEPPAPSTYFPSSVVSKLF